MPYRQEWVEPDMLLRHDGVTIYRQYKDDEADNVLDYWFQVHNPRDPLGTVDLLEFDVRDLAEWRSWKLHHGTEHDTIKRVIQAAIKSGSLATLLGIELVRDNEIDFEDF